MQLKKPNLVHEVRPPGLLQRSTHPDQLRTGLFRASALTVRFFVVFHAKRSMIAPPHAYCNSHQHLCTLHRRFTRTFSSFAPSESARSSTHMYPLLARRLDVAAAPAEGSGGWRIGATGTVPFAAHTQSAFYPERPPFCEKNARKGMQE